MKRFVLTVLCVLSASLASAAPMSNADVVRLVKSGMDEDTITLSIQTAEPKFDLSTDGLLALRADAVSPAIIKAMLKATQEAGKEHPAAAPAAPAGAPDATKGDPEKIVWEHGTDRVLLKYIIPSNRTALRAMGWGGAAIYMVLSGSSAVQRVSERQPKFVVAVPENAQPTSYMTLASFAVRPNGTREVLVGGGYGSFSSGIHPDRIVATTAVRLESQEGCTPGFTLYRVTPVKPLIPGEYALVLSNEHYRTAGFFANVNASCFDFGVDFAAN